MPRQRAYWIYTTAVWLPRAHTLPWVGAEMLTGTSYCPACTSRSERSIVTIKSPDFTDLISSSSPMIFTF